MSARRCSRRLPAGTRTLLPLACALAAIAAAARPAAAAAQPAPQQVQAQVTATVASQPLPAGFLGLSVEYSALHAYLGRDAQNPNPVFLQLLKGIDQGHSPVLRIGGNSTDATWLPLPGVVPPFGVSYQLTPDWLATVRTMAQKLDAKLILGVNLGADDAQLAGAEAHALVSAIGRRYIDALEIGNEPDLYNRVWYTLPNGTGVKHRNGTYTYDDYAADVADWHAALPNMPLAVGALASLSWAPDLTTLAAQYPNVTLATVHRYPLSYCSYTPSTSASYPTLAHLLSDSSTAGLAAPLLPYADALNGQHISFRVDELNSASCEGAPGVSNTFASALWLLDTLFNMAGANVDGINVHTLPGSEYAPFTFSTKGGKWTAQVRPLYYGLLTFARAFPPGAELLAVNNPSAANGGDVKVYATRARNGQVRATVINEDAATPADVQLQLPVSGDLSVQALTAPSLTATTGVALGGKGFGASTARGTLPAPVTTTVAPSNGTYNLELSPASAVVVTSGG